MGEGGCQDRKTVEHVLTTGCKALGHSVVIQGNVVKIFKGGIPYSFELADECTRKFLQKISKKFGIPIEWFYNPSMIGDGGKAKH